MLRESEIDALLEPFGVRLSPEQAGQLCTYLDVLMRWNAKINLTSIRDPKECVARHFGESLLLAESHRLTGRLLDVGSGAGFPGLALKIAAPTLNVTLLEPVSKKRAFLKEAARQCVFEGVEVLPARLEDFSRDSNRKFEVITARAVGGLERLVARSVSLLSESGKVCLWLSRKQTERLTASGNQSGLGWGETITIPTRPDSAILIGTRSDVSRETSNDNPAVPF